MDNFVESIPEINIKSDINNDIKTYIGAGGRKILLDLPSKTGTAYLSLENNSISINYEDDENILLCDEKLLISGRVIDKMCFAKIEQLETKFPYYVGFALFINEGVTKGENIFQMFGILENDQDKFKLDPITFVKTECAKIAHVFLDDWHVPIKIMLTRKDMRTFDVFGTDGSDFGTFDFEENCIPDRSSATKNNFFLATSQGLEKWELTQTDIALVELLPLKVSKDRFFVSKCRTTPQTPDDQVVYTGFEAYFLCDGKRYEIEGATELVGYNFALTDKGLFFIEGWPDGQLKPRLVTKKQLKPLLFDCIESDDYCFRAFFTDENTNDLYVFCGTDTLEAFRITGFGERILDIRVSFDTDEFYICGVKLISVVSDFAQLPKAQVRFED